MGLNFPRSLLGTVFFLVRSRLVLLLCVCVEKCLAIAKCDVFSGLRAKRKWIHIIYTYALHEGRDVMTAELKVKF